MAKNFTDHVAEYWAEVPLSNENMLGAIRDWDNIQVALEDNTIWLKNILYNQINSPELKQIPNLIVYSIKDGLLFEKEKLVPSKKIKTALLWTPIHRAIPLTIPLFNPNYFGIHDTIDVKLLPGKQEQEAFALLCNYNDIEHVIPVFPKFKLKKISWLMLDHKALLIGVPILALPGKTFWLSHNHLLPMGLDFQYSNSHHLLQKKYNPTQEYYLYWTEDGKYFPIHKNDFEELTLSSFKRIKKLL